MLYVCKTPGSNGLGVFFLCHWHQVMTLSPVYNDEQVWCICRPSATSKWWPIWGYIVSYLQGLRRSKQDRASQGSHTSPSYHGVVSLPVKDAAIPHVHFALKGARPLLQGSEYSPVSRLSVFVSGYFILSHLQVPPSYHAKTWAFSW